MLKGISQKNIVFQCDKERDITIIGLILGTELRVSGIATLTFEMLI